MVNHGKLADPFTGFASLPFGARHIPWSNSSNRNWRTCGSTPYRSVLIDVVDRRGDALGLRETGHIQTPDLHSLRPASSTFR